MVPILLALEWGGRTYPWRSPEVLALAAFGLVMFVVFLVVETRAPEAIMPPRLFRDRVVGPAALAAMLTAVAMFGATLFIPLFIQSVIGASATRSGAVLTPMMTTMVLASGFAGFYVTRKGDTRRCRCSAWWRQPWACSCCRRPEPRRTPASSWR